MAIEQLSGLSAAILVPICVLLMGLRLWPRQSGLVDLGRHRGGRNRAVWLVPAALVSLAAAGATALVWRRSHATLPQPAETGASSTESVAATGANSAEPTSAEPAAVTRANPDETTAPAAPTSAESAEEAPGPRTNVAPEHVITIPLSQPAPGIQIPPLASPRVLWFGMLIGPAAWAALLAINYTLVYALRDTGWEWFLYLVAIVAILLSLAGLVVAWRSLTPRPVVLDAAGGPELAWTRVDFMAFSGVLLSGLFLLINLATGVTTLLFNLTTG